MTDAQTPSHGTYKAEFLDGPLAGTTETRSLVEGEYEEEISSLAMHGGIESMFWYTAGETREIEGVLHVKYKFDRSDSDSLDLNNDVDSLRF